MRTRTALISSGLLAALALTVACSGHADQAEALDPMGQLMLDPRRDDLLRPAELIARLGLANDAVVADIGAGPGYLALPLARAVPNGRLIATDVRADYLAVLASRARRAGLPNVSTKLATRERSALEPRSVDLAMLCQVDHYLGDRAAYLEGLRVALRDEGRIVIINDIGRRAAALEAVEHAALRIVDDWRPSPLYFAIVAMPKDAT